MKSYYTYLHCKPDGTPFYVGKGEVSRKRGYDFTQSRNRHYRAIVEKYGRESIQDFVFPCDSEQQAFNDEVQQIACLRNLGVRLCNMTAGGDGFSGGRHTPESKAKISALHKGRKRSAETKAKLSASKLGNKSRSGMKRTDETRAKMSLAQIGNTHNLGKKLSDETKAKISAAHRRRHAQKDTP